MSFHSVRAVLFDLDGTLADTAPDLVGALNSVRAEEGLPPLPVRQMRTYASQGARGLLREGLGIQRERPDYPLWAERFLVHYEHRLCAETRLFSGIPELLADLSSRKLLWGIVTNKFRRFTVPLAEAIGLSAGAACIVCGDTTTRPKPAPDPLLHACQMMGVAPAECLYVGDDLRDIQAGKAAGCATIAVAWGYHGDEVGILDWGADMIADTPDQIISTLD